MLFDPSDFAFVNGGVGSAGLSLVANTKSANGLFDPRFAPTQLATASSRLESAIRYLLTEKYASAPAAWYNPNDMSTLFQDAAGTVPVTAVEQPVGLQLDKSGRGYHRSQTTATKRPVLSRRVNLFSGTESPSSDGWAPAFANVVGFTITAETSVGQHYIYSTPALTVPGSAVVRFTARANGYPRIMLREATTSGNMVLFDLIAGTVANTQGYTGSITPSVILPGWFDCTVNLTDKSQFGERLSVVVGNSSTTNWGSAVFAGDGVSGVDVTRLQFVRATDANLPYQRVTTASDYDADPAKFPAYLSIDGVDDAMVTATQTGWDTTNAVTAFAALQRFDNAATGMAAELGADASAGSGWALSAPPSAAANTMQMLSNGGTAASATAPSAAAYKGILTGSANILTPSVQARFNGVAGTAVTSTQGAGPYANNPINWFSRNQAGNYFKGNAFGEIVIGAQMLDAEVALIEKYLAMKAGVTL